jgi:tryptophan 2-C-methyltransferase
MKVLLVNTNRVKPPIAPIGLDYMADSVLSAGHEATLLDLCFSGDIERDIERACGGGPALIGCTIRNTDDCFFSSGAFFLPGIREIIQSLREHSDAPIALGGVGFSLMPEAIVEYCGADFGIAGEGEESFVQLLASLGGVAELEQVPGLVFWDEGGLQRNRPVDVLLDRLPARTRSFVENRRYFAEGGQAGFETKRGCPMTCVYCADPASKGRRSRLLPPRKVVDELRALHAQGIDALHTCDCEFNIPLVHAQDVCRAIIDAGLGDRIRWYAYCSVAPFDEETAKLLRRAGCAGIDFGADSGSAEMLRRLGRHFTPSALEQTARICRDAGIPFMFDLLLGSPGETAQTMQESLDLVRRANPDCIGISLGVRVYDGTALAEQVRAMGPLDANPALHGSRLDNERLLRPVFYLAPEMGPDPGALVRRLAGDDRRFLLPGGPDVTRDFNYNDNDLLVQAIGKGARGAYWDILRKLKEG